MNAIPYVFPTPVGMFYVHENGFIASINVFPTSVGMLLIWGKAALCPTVDAKPVKFPPDPNTQGY